MELDLPVGWEVSQVLDSTSALVLYVHGTLPGIGYLAFLFLQQIVFDLAIKTIAKKSLPFDSEPVFFRTKELLL